MRMESLLSQVDKKTAELQRKKQEHQRVAQEKARMSQQSMGGGGGGASSGRLAQQVQEAQRELEALPLRSINS